MAKAEMGSLRDPWFVIPMLESENFEYRISAVAYLAFLQLPEHEDILFRTTLNDPDSGVRQVALWAYAFRKGINLQELLKKVKLIENNRNVLDLSRRLAEDTALSV